MRYSSYEQVLETAMQQSATDLGCSAADLRKAQNTVVLSKQNEGARRYLTLPFACNLVCYGDGVVASVSPQFAQLAKCYIDSREPIRCFETPHILLFDAALQKLGARLCHMARYYLPDPQKVRPLPCPYPIRILEKEELTALHISPWTDNALSSSRPQLDMLAAAAYDGDEIIGMAGVSADCEEMWQIGIDVLPAYRRQGVAAALTSTLAAQVLSRGKLPFYCAAWSNIASEKNALRSGFVPAWCELTALPEDKAMAYAAPFAAEEETE
ncbi:MAG: GNAT family N-acetyltransferase [Oscillospiraceae bacterium]|nr:GNAT family N-acetyltransferase [Oscillospiraceae bacterium]